MAGDLDASEIPRIISVVEPPHVWQTYLPSRLPSRLRDRGPRVVRDTYGIEWVHGNQVFTAWPHPLEPVHAFADRLEGTELHKVLRGNAAALLGLADSVPG